MIRSFRIALIAALALLVSSMAFAAPAVGAPAVAAPVGENIGDLIKGLAGPIVFSLGGLTALGAYMRRDVGMAFTAVVITLIVGLFVTTAGQTALKEVSEIIADALDTKG